MKLNTNEMVLLLGLLTNVRSNLDGIRDNLYIVDGLEITLDDEQVDTLDNLIQKLENI